MTTKPLEWTSTPCPPEERLADYAVVSRAQGIAVTYEIVEELDPRNSFKVLKASLYLIYKDSKVLKEEWFFMHREAAKLLRKVADNLHMGGATNGETTH